MVFFLRAIVVSPRLLDVGGFCNGILAGLVSITAGCAFVKPWETVIIGLIGGLIYQLASMLLKWAKIDDVVDAFPVHGACGIWGVMQSACSEIQMTDLAAMASSMAAISWGCSSLAS